jgi:hypothetical protein
MQNASQIPAEVLKMVQKEGQILRVLLEREMATAVAVFPEQAHFPDALKKYRKMTLKAIAGEEGRSVGKIAFL